MSMKQQYGQPKDNYHAKIIAKSTFIFIICVILTLICLIPIYILIVNSTHGHMDLAKNPSNFWFGDSIGDNFNTLLGKVKTGAARQYSGSFDVVQGYINSLLIAGATTGLTVFFSALTAYGLTVYDFKLRSAAYTFIIAVMMIPVQVSSAGFVRFMYQLGLINNYIPLIVPAIAAPAVIFFMRSYMKSSFPLDIVEAARIDGCAEFRTFLTIAIPMMKPAIAVQAIFTFVGSWNNYFVPSLILDSAKNKTLPILIWEQRNTDWKNFNLGTVYMMILLSIFPVIVVYFLLSKYIVGGVALGSVKG